MKIVIIGFGFIGQQIVKSFQDKNRLIKEVDKKFRVVGISNSKGFIFNDKGLDLVKIMNKKDLSCFSKCYYSSGSSVELIEKSKPDLMVETTPTNILDGEPGLTHIEEAFKRGIHVVTPNKGPLVVGFKKLTSLAQRNNCRFLFEGTVAGALPVFSLVERCLKGDKVTKIQGILNGTTNYILSKMYFEETSFELALKEAQERGLTERDVSYDVDGIDATSKIVILANAIMKRDVKFEDVEHVGIRGVTQEAVTLAKKSNFAIKLIGTIDHYLEVRPKLVPIDHPLCVHGTLNAINLETDLAREISLVGYGAGKETVSAVLNDILTVLREEPSSIN